MDIRGLYFLLVTLPLLAGEAQKLSNPSFGGNERVHVTAVRGTTAALHCTVLHLKNHTVSWVRTRDLQILMHAGMRFTADSRVTAAVTTAGGGGERHSLYIAKVRASDAGQYECQLNTEPKSSHMYYLTVTEHEVPIAVPVVRFMGSALETAATGRSATLHCEARWQPPAEDAPSLHIHWYKEDRPLTLLDDDGGGMWIESEQRPQGGAVSRLSLAVVTPADAGRYSCVAAAIGGDSDLPPATATVTLLVDALTEAESAMEAMQRDQSAPSIAPALLPLLPLLLLPFLLPLT